MARSLKVAVFFLLLFVPLVFLESKTQKLYADTFPSFWSLKSDTANLRVGPGKRYPIEWVYKRKGLPLVVTASFDRWRRVRDHEGALGWIHQKLLSPRRTVLIVDEVQNVRASPSRDARLILRAEPGVIAELLQCEGEWCRVTLSDKRGWIFRNSLWGVGAPIP